MLLEVESGELLDVAELLDEPCEDDERPESSSEDLSLDSTLEFRSEPSFLSLRARAPGASTLRQSRTRSSVRITITSTEYRRSLAGQMT